MADVIRAVAIRGEVVFERVLPCEAIAPLVHVEHGVRPSPPVRRCPGLETRGVDQPRKTWQDGAGPELEVDVEKPPIRGLAVLLHWPPNLFVMQTLTRQEHTMPLRLRHGEFPRGQVLSESPRHDSSLPRQRPARAEVPLVVIEDSVHLDNLFKLQSLLTDSEPIAL